MQYRKRWTLVALLGVSIVVGGCSPSPSNSISTSTHTGPSDGLKYSPTIRPQFSKAIQDRGRAIREATVILEANAQGKPINPDLVSASAELLGSVRATNSSAIEALVANIEFTPPISIVGEPHPLECLDVAQALEQIGGRQVTDALLQSLRNRSTAKKQWIVAHLLAYEDSPEVASFRIALAIQKEQSNPCPDQDYIRKLRTVKSFLDRPELLQSIQRWPGSFSAP